LLEEFSFLAPSLFCAGAWGSLRCPSLGVSIDLQGWRVLGVTMRLDDDLDILIEWSATARCHGHTCWPPDGRQAPARLDAMRDEQRQPAVVDFPAVRQKFEIPQQDIAVEQTGVAARHQS
jgi:hypothetical protein